MKADEAREAVAQQVEAPLAEDRSRVQLPEAHVQVRPRSARTSGPTSTAMVDEALEKSRDGNIVSRVTRSITGGEVERRRPVKVTYDQEEVDRLVKRVERKIERKPTDAKVEFTGTGLKKVRGKAGVDAARGRPRPGGRRRARPPEPRPDRQGARDDDQAEGRHRRPGRQVPDRRDDRPRQLQAAPVQEAEAQEDLPDRRRHRSASRRPPACTTSRTRRSTRPGTSRSGAATWPARSSPAARPEPAQGALARHLRRRGHPRHRRGRLARHVGIARLRPDGDPGRDGGLRLRSRGRARSTSPRAR